VIVMSKFDHFFLKMYPKDPNIQILNTKTRLFTILVRKTNAVQFE